MSIVAISSYSFHALIRRGENTLQDTPRLARSCGADAIEFALGGSLSPPLDRSTAERLRRACEREAIPICSICVAADLLNGDRADRRAARQAVIAQLDVAATIIGVSRFRHDATLGPASGALDDENYRAALPILAESCRAIADRAAELGVRSSIENHGRFVQHADRVLALVEAVDHSAFGVTLDIGNTLFAPQDPVEATRTLAPHASNVHVKDFRVESRRPRDPTFRTPNAWPTYPGGPKVVPTAIGDGDVDIRACVDAIRASGYDGPWVVEFEGSDSDPRRGARIGAQRLRAVLSMTDPIGSKTTGLRRRS